MHHHMGKSLRYGRSNHSPKNASLISSCSMVIGGQWPTRIRRRRSTSYPSPISARRRRKASSISGASQSGHANLSSSLSATPRRGSHAVMMPSAFCGVGMPSRRRLASERRKEGEEFNTSHFSGNGDRPLLGHQLDRPSTFGRPRTVAMVDRWRVSLINPYPSRGGVMVIRVLCALSSGFGSALATCGIPRET